METASEGVAQKLTLIETYLEQLRTIARPEALRTDVREQRFIARTLQIAMQAAKDTAAQLTELEDSGNPRSGAYVFQHLAKSGWVPASLLPRLRTLNRLRQTLIHRADAGADLIEEALREAPDTLLEFVGAVRFGIQPLSDASSLAAALGNLGFGRIEEAVVLSALLGIRGKDPEDLKEALSETRSALRKAIVFLRDIALFPRVELLPSPGMLPILAVFFHEHPAPSPRTRQLLARWTWRRAVRSADWGETTPWQQTIRAILPGHEDESVKNLLAEEEAYRLDGTDFLLKGSTSGSIQLLLALLAVHPRHLVPGEELEALLSAKRPEALTKEDLIAFLAGREEDLQKTIGDFLQSKAEWNASDRDRPALASLIVADE